MYIPKARNNIKSSNFHQGADTYLIGKQHYEHSSDKNGENKGLSCFRCDRVGHLATSCTYDKKENDDNVSTKEEINKKYEERAEAKKTRWGGKICSSKSIGGSENFMNSETIDYTDLRDSDSIPDFEETILDKEEYDGQAYCQSKIVLDLRDFNHVFNQTGSHKSLNLYGMLCDNQSACDVIANPSFVKNIRFSTVNLVLRT